VQSRRKSNRSLFADCGKNSNKSLSAGHRVKKYHITVHRWRRKNCCLQFVEGSVLNKHFAALEGNAVNHPSFLSS
jgi:hypothetical protein